ncbi:unnamed protein product [Cyprideis torosa]|uniref:Uncharacterized protein n=1 Tax=Cyprideis torosa TaxID=163714 RepID=A0A7R8W939_9CRUS|nr:unnamed protein product [Cyprideis torosa]CAG0883976.1 unnamed protein product [Cyprideis torosa]
MCNIIQDDTTVRRIDFYLSFPNLVVALGCAWIYLVRLLQVDYPQLPSQSQALVTSLFDDKGRPPSNVDLLSPRMSLLERANQLLLDRGLEDVVASRHVQNTSMSPEVMMQRCQEQREVFEIALLVGCILHFLSSGVMLFGSLNVEGWTYRLPVLTSGLFLAIFAASDTGVVIECCKKQNL